MKNKEKKVKVIVAMSGGVDSSVVAVLLKKQGFDVVGIFMKFWNPSTSSGQGGENRCCSTESEKMARLVANKIGIPFYVINVEKEFKKRVVDYFLKEIKEGKTPNPCVVCNKEIKFGLLLEKALKMGAEYIATGHYARLRREIPNPKSEIRNKLQITNYKLQKAIDENKDQSYFLWQLNQKQLSHTLFPIGEYTKPEVRKLAKKFKLPTAETPESQEICFVSKDINDFLKKYLKSKPGPICLLENRGTPDVPRKGDKKEIGKHEGLQFYTIGQRKGIKLSGGPYFVIAKDFKKNALIVSLGRSQTGEAKIPKDLLRKELIAKDVNWACPPKFCKAKFWRVKAKIRYRSKETSAKVFLLNEKKVKVIFSKPQRAITPGQSVVFYLGKELLGGGIIDEN